MAASLAERASRRFLADLADAEAVQRSCLLEHIVGPNRASEYGRAHGFDSIRAVDDYRRRVPIVDYEDIRARVDRIAAGEEGVLTTEPVRHLFTTSGSTAAPKYIPVTSSFVRDKWRVFQVWWTLLFERHPDARAGRIVTNFADSGGVHESAGGIPTSSESTFWSSWTSRMQAGEGSPLPREVSSIEDFEARYYVIARILLEEDLSLLMTLNPSTILLLLQKLEEFADELIEDVARGGIARAGVPDAVRSHVEARYEGSPARAAAIRATRRAEEPLFVASDLWPRMRLAVSWRGPMLEPYLRLLTPRLGSVEQAEYPSMASEGMLAVPLADRPGGGVPATGIHFYEFVPEEELEAEDPRTLLAHELEEGRSYGVLLSTSAGLYRYDLGDVVRVNAFEGTTPVVEFQHRSGATSSMTGEKLTEAQVSAAVSRAARTHGLALESFTAVSEPDPFPHYVLLVETAGGAGREALRGLLGSFDRELAVENVEYEAKRRSLRLGAPELWLVEPRSYEAWRTRRVAAGANEDQVKPKHLSRDPEFKREFRVLERIHAD